MELCAGREGDDAYVSLTVGQTLTQGDIDNLADVLYRASVALESEKLRRDAHEEKKETP
jgi:hypothetical protein